MHETPLTTFQALAGFLGFLLLLALVWQAAWLSWRLLREGAIAGLRRLRGLRPPRDHPIRAWLETRWPRTYRALAARLDPTRFSGLPLTLLAAAALYLAVLFAGLVEEVLEAEEISGIDEALTAAIAPLRHPLLVRMLDWITQLGSMPALTAVAIVATGFLWSHGPRRYIAPVWLTVLGSQLTTWGGKFLIARPRPEFLLDVTAYSPSFPSGHATGAAAVYGIVAYAILRDLPDARARFEVGFWTTVLIALIAFSRVFLSVHYPSDIAAGLLVGGFWLLAGIALAETSRPVSS